MKINLNNAVERNFNGISAEYAKKLQDNRMTVWYDEITETYIIYDEEGNDQEELTFDELQRR